MHDFDDLFGARATLLGAQRDGLDLLVLDAPQLFDRPGGPYIDAGGKDYPDNWKRFAALSLRRRRNRRRALSPAGGRTSSTPMTGRRR